jgi:hypothetical protein
MKLPILKSIHLTAMAVIYIAVTGCTRHTEVIILKKPNTVEYAEVMAGLR